MSLEDITDRFADLNDHDRVYSSPAGYTVKVKVLPRATGHPDRLCFVVSGSLCHDRTAKAQAFADGHFICGPHEVLIQNDSEPGDLEDARRTLSARIEEARRMAVARVEAAALNHAAAAAYGAPITQEPAS